MTFPTGTPVVTLTGTLPSAVGGTGLTGRIVLTPSTVLTDTTRHAVYPGGGTTDIVDGTFTVQLIPNNAAGISPTGWRWQVDLQPSQGSRITFWTDIHGSDGDTIHLDELVPTSAPSNGGDSGQSSSPSGEAGGALAGTYPNPSLSAATIALFDTAGAATTAQTAATATAATDASTKVAAHASATDPHGDRAAATTSLATHSGASTSVHGIADTAALETKTGAQAKVDTAVIAEVQRANTAYDAAGAASAAQTAAINAAATDATSKAATAQSTAITTAASDATSKVAAHASASDPHGDRTYADGKLAKTANLSDLSNINTARTSLGLGGAATLNVGTTAGTVAAGNDSRLTDTRTPTAHAASHASGGSDPVTLAQSQITGLTAALAAALQLSGGTMTGTTNATLATPGTAAEASLVSGDTFDRYRRYADGKQEWGPGGTGARDTNLYRDAVASLHTDGALTVPGALKTTGAMTWRRRHLPDPVTADALYTGAAPTISTAQTSTPTSGYIKYAPTGVTLAGSDVTGPFTYLGAGNMTVGTGTPDNTSVLPTSRYPNTRTTNASSQSVWSVEFGTDAQTFQLRFNYQTAGVYRLSIDGRKVTDLLQAVGGTTAGSTHLMTIDLGSAAPRTIRLDFYTVPFGGAFLPPTATMWSTVPNGGRFMVFGDSLSDGSAQNTGGGGGTWVHRAARLLGSNDCWDEARGGTGYITVGAFAILADRVAADVIAWTPNRLVVWAGYNDNGGSQTTIGTAAASLYATIKAGLPDCETYVIGCWSPTAAPATSITNTDNTLKAAAAGAGFPFISPLTGACYDATGTLVATHGPWITSANAAAYIGGDAVHPTDAGHVYLSRRITAAIRQLMPA